MSKIASSRWRNDLSTEDRKVCTFYSTAFVEQKTPLRVFLRKFFKVYRVLNSPANILYQHSIAYTFISVLEVSRSNIQGQNIRHQTLNIS